MNRINTLILSFFIVVAPFVQAQKQKPLAKKNSAAAIKPKIQSKSTTSPTPSTSDDEEKVKNMVKFYEFMLNTLGNSNTSSRDKDVMITESYSKIFRDANVQVEDDLDEERTVVTNKDVVDYLKDINFFFKEASFEFTIDRIEKNENADHEPFYKVSLHRNLHGITIDGKNINNSLERFIEVNYNSENADLKLVSIYTHEINPKDALITWWRNLSFEWHSLFQKKFKLTDSVSVSDIQKITAIEELDLSHNNIIQSFEPISKLKNLKSLNLSNTRCVDISPLRNLTGLVDLNISQTAVNDLSPLRYSQNLEKLNLSNTKVTDIQLVQRFSSLSSLDMASTEITDFNAISGLAGLKNLNLNKTRFNDPTLLQNLTKLAELNISNTLVKDLSALNSSSNLALLFCDSTKISSLNALSNLTSLKELHANYTSVTDLKPIQKLTQLKKIYCDKSNVSKETAEAFMSAHSGVTVVYNSRDLNLWWNNLEDSWKEVIAKASSISRNPSIEELSRVGNLDSINLKGKNVASLEPLRMLEKLKFIIAANTPIQDLSPISGHKDLIYIDVSETNITDLSPLKSLMKLQFLAANQCKISDVDVVGKGTSLKKLYVNGTTINDINARAFLQLNPNCLLVYKTSHLTRWWKNLSIAWRATFLLQLKDTTQESLHNLVEQESFEFKDSQVSDLWGLSEFIRLKNLKFAGTAIAEIVPTPYLVQLKSLHATNSPIQNIESINLFGELEDLNISNTPIVDLYPIWALQKLKHLNCAGTQIKRLEGAEKLESLEELDCSNTNVSKLVALDYLHLKSFICYNTKISSRTIEHFIGSHPDCRVVYYR